MSKYVDELINSIKSQPDTWADYKGHGIQKENIIICLFGNTRAFSVIDVVINNKTIPTTYIDRWKLETAISNWYQTVSLNTILK